MMSIGSNLVPANNAAHWAAFVCLKSVEWVIRVGATISRAADRLDVGGGLPVLVIRLVALRRGRCLRRAPSC